MSEPIKPQIKKWLGGLRTAECPDEFETKALLDKYGVLTPSRVRLAPGDLFDPEFAPAPYVLKVCSPHILHKTDQGGVILDIPADAIGDRIREMRERFPDTSLLVERQLSFVGPEFIVGALVDPSFGPAVMVGAGGILTELFKDVAFRLAPCERYEAEKMLGELTVAPVFKGYRGLEITSEGLARIITAAGSAALDLGGRFSQLDINPVVFSRGRWVALDAKLVLH